MPTSLRRIKRVFCVIEARPEKGAEGKIISERDFQACMNDFSLVIPCKFWGILHDNDYNDDGELERPHFHVAISALSKKTITGFVHDLAETFLIDPNRVSVRETKNLVKSVRYLMHMDDTDKTQYLPFDVITNDKGFLIECISRPYDELDAQDLIKVVEECPDRISVIQRIGLKNFQRYARTIEIIAQEKRKW